MSGRWCHRVLFGVVLFLAATACGSGPVLRQSADGGGGARLPNVPVGQPYVFGSLMVCSSGGPVEIESVVPHDAWNGFRVEAWGVRPNPFESGRDGASGLGAEPDVLTSFPDFTHSVVTGSCGDEDHRIYELGVQVSRTGDESAWAQGLEIRFATGSLVLPFSIALCEHEAASAPPDLCAP